MSIITKLFGTLSDREIKKITPICNKVLSYEEEYSLLSDSQLKAKTNEFKQRLANGETLDDILPEAFATVREAAWRTLEMKHFPVQIIGGIVLHNGAIGEMMTGSGKTLTATLPTYLNALTGNGVHIVTVNDYLAKRDSVWMGKIYNYLGLSVGLVINGKSPAERKAAYALLWHWKIHLPEFEKGVLGQWGYRCDQREAGQRITRTARIYLPQSAVYADFL